MFLRKLCAFAALCVPALFPASAAEPAAQDAVVVDAQTEEVLRGAMRWLASKQNVNGSWNESDSRRANHPVAITGYVLIAFMATGNLPEEGEYAKQVKAGLDFLLDSIGVDGQYRSVDGGQYIQPRYRNHRARRITGSRATRSSGKNCSAQSGSSSPRRAIAEATRAAGATSRAPAMRTSR